MVNGGSVRYFLSAEIAGLLENLTVVSLRCVAFSFLHVTLTIIPVVFGKWKKYTLDEVLTFSIFKLCQSDNWPVIF